MTRFARLCFVLTLLAAAPAAGGAQAQNIEAPSPAARQAILGTIKAQLDAFQRNDGAAAFSYATPALRQLFGTPENFMAMVRGGYQPVYRPRSVEFLDARIIEGRIGQAVRFVGPDGRAVIALYTMEQQPDGSWRIAAVHLVPSDELSS
ncbi:DUF4864 domain-containing protein [Pelagibius sp. 7325]|uniref:DUF4864 domain-containing protein n=1 Tax=Pelagibius sp. 7325 TaxID=3131994 RepID=UPI0030EE091E